MLTTSWCAISRQLIWGTPVVPPSSHNGSVKPQVSHLVVTHLHDLIALSIGATHDATAMAGRSVRAARLRAIKCDIAANLEHFSIRLGVA